MENFELNITAPPKREHNWFPIGHVPFNKGKKWPEYMDMRKAKRIKKYLELGRKLGNKNLAGANRIPIVGIKDEKIYPFDSAPTATRILKAKGIKINARNIRAVCQGRPVNNNGTQYVRKTAGGFRWFYADEPEKYSNFFPALK